MNTNWEVIMEPVVGVDVAKGFSVVQAFLKRNEPYGKMISISHGEGGFKYLGRYLQSRRQRQCDLRSLFLKRQVITTADLPPI